jgi:septal ring factor EnvC (AmiA/AmiB activator)
VRGKRTCICAYCGATFYTPLKPGPAARYCRPAHRQRAYEERRRARDAQDSTATTDEVQTLRTRVRLLELDNRKLRDELAETEAEMYRLNRELNPLPPGLAQLTAGGTSETHQLTEATATQKRRLRRNQT